MQSRRLFPIIHRLFGFTRITASGIIRKHLIAVLLAAVVTSLSIPPQIASATFLETIDRLGDALNRHGAGLAISQPSVLQGAAYRSGEMLVRFKAGVSQNDRDMIAATQGARRKKQLRGESAIEKLEFTSGNDPAAMAAQLILNPQIEFAEPNYLIAKDQAETTPNDPRFAEQWAIKNIGQNGGQYGSDIGVALAWNKTTGAQSTTIAIIDSGVDFSHPDLAGNQWTNSHPTTGDTHGWDYITDTGDVKDEYGHGTAIAGIIAAQGNNSAGVSGVMWRASLMSLRVLDNTGTGDVASAVEAIDYAIAHGAQVINLSWGTPAASIALKDAIQRATRQNIIVVCSAGNNSQDISLTPYYPASFDIDGLVSVAATDNSDRLASWSNWSSQRITIAAPGVGVLTTQKGGGYWNVSGTSASAPLVTGVVGLMKTLNPLLDSRGVVKAITKGVREVASLSDKVSAGGVVSAIDATNRVRQLPPNPYQAPTPGNGGNNQTGSSNGLYGPDNGNDPRRAYGKEGLRVQPPAIKTGAPLANLPDLDRSRSIRKSPTTTAPSAPIQANMACADCDPSGGGGVGGSDPYFGTARNRPENRTGESGVSLASRNFNWGLPIVSLPGRAGMDLNISLYYNSLVWTKQGTAILYNADHGTPSPGFQIGLPRLQAQYLNLDRNAYAYTMITPSGGRTEMTRLPSPNLDIFEATDGSYAQLTYYTMPIVRTSDGTQYIFGTQVGAEWRCTGIEDRNGNIISASYEPNNGHVLTITDTLARTIYFDYNADGNLEHIRQTWNGGVTHYWATFEYAPNYVYYNFYGLNASGAPYGANQTVLSAVKLGTSSSYLSDYEFDYNSYGQVYQIRHNAGDGHQLEHTLYTINTSGAQSDCPKVSDRRDYAQDWNGGSEAITYYYVTNGASWYQPETGAYNTGTLVQVQTPDSTLYCEYSHASGWDAGMPRLSEWWTGINKKKWVSTNWTQDNTSSPVPINPRVIETNIYDDNGNHSRRTIEYNAGYNLPTAVNEYSASGPLLRRTENSYLLWQDYIDHRIIGLPYQRDVWDSQTGALMSRTTYHFDWTGSDFFEDTPTAATQHDRTNINPTSPADRGNLSDIIQFDVINDPNNDNHTAHETKFRYNSTGSLLMKRDASFHAIYFDYADNFTDGNRNTFAYPTTVTDADGYSSTTEYNYDFGAVTKTHVPTSGTNAGGNVTYLDVVRHYDDDYGRLDQITSQTNQTTRAYTYFVYEPNANYVHTYQTIKDLTQANEFHSWQVFDGAGRVRAEAADHPGGAGLYQGSYVIYDNMGRVAQQSNPNEMNGSWSPSSWALAGEDPVWRVTQQTYDWKGRPLQTTNTDGTTRILSYGGCGCAGGEVTTAQDEHGRQKRYTKDALGRLATVEELNWIGSVYATTSYSYNARDQITQINQQGLLRSFGYDGHGRLNSRTTPEQGTTTYTYYADDTTNVVTDARGATTSFTYNGRHQATRLQYGAAGGASATPEVNFVYDAAGNRTRMDDGLGYVTYNYNNLGELESEGRNFSSLGTAYNLTYAYNPAGELTSITNHWGAAVGYTYDKAGRVTEVRNASGYASAPHYATSITYRAFGAIKSMNYGDSKSLATAYDGRLRPTKMSVAGVLGYKYYYDDFNEHTGRVTFAQEVSQVDSSLDRTQTTSSLDRSYEYDQVGRLVYTHTGAEARAHAWTGQWNVTDGPYSQDYSYDQWGNMTQRHGWGGEVQGGSPTESTTIPYTYTNNRRTDSGFTYDPAGNLTFDGGQTFTYDVTGQQTYASYMSVSQDYDGDGLRVKKTENGTTTYYLRSTVLGGQVVAEINASGSWQRGYVYQGSSLMAVQDSGVYWVHEDPITKSKRVTNAYGSVVSTIELDPWGADTNRSSSAAFQPKKFTSYHRDNNGTDEAMFRRYNRWHSRFDQPDPADQSYDSSDPQSFNRYAYVQNDPVTFVDPSGLMPRICGLRETEGGGIEPVYCSDDRLSDYLLVLNSRFRGFDGVRGGAGPQNTNIISLHNTAHSNYANCTSILTNSPAAKLKGDMALHFVDEATALSVLDTSALEGVDATLIAAMWAAESSFGLNPSNHYRAGDGGEDIGPMQLANTVWNKSPYIDNLGDVFGTNQSRGGTFNGNPYANLRAGARAINDAGGSRANKAGVFRAGASWAKTTQGIAAYNSRVRQFNAWAKTYDDFFDCLRRR